MDRFLDWCNSNINPCLATDAKKYYENLECSNLSPILDTVILFKKNNELYRENINAMYEIFNCMMFEKTVDIDVYKYIKSNTLSYDDFVKKYKTIRSPLIQFLIDNLEYKPCDIKIALK